MPVSLRVNLLLIGKLTVTLAFFFICMVVIGARDKGTGGGGGRGQLLWKFGQMLGKIKNIRADLPEYMLNSGFFIATAP
jgi:hypothetical protein